MEYKFSDMVEVMSNEAWSQTSGRYINLVSEKTVSEYKQALSEINRLFCELGMEDKMVDNDGLFSFPFLAYTHLVTLHERQEGDPLGITTVWSLCGFSLNISGYPIQVLMEKSHIGNMFIYLFGKVVKVELEDRHYTKEEINSIIVDIYEAQWLEKFDNEEEA